jgi:putative FmdB family regulatory protein
MPTYAFRCKSCSYEFEEFQTISESSLTECPSCKQQTVVRMIGGGAGLVFKGSGFYLTDYKNSSKSGETKSSSPSKKDSAESTASNTKTESTSESKSETKSESKTESTSESKSKSSDSTKPSNGGSSAKE